MSYQETVNTGSFADKMKHNTKSRIQIENLSTPDASNNDQPCTLILKIGNSEFLEVKGTIRPACLPSIHR